MRISFRMIATMAVLGWCWSCLNAIAQNQLALSELVQKLRSDKKTNEARKQSNWYRWQTPSPTSNLIWPRNCRR
jgi:hypothetical protein